MQLKKLKTNFLGRHFIFYNEIDSTQNEIWRLIENNNIKNGTLVMADIQSEGKGTHGRIWHTDETNNVAFSFFVEMNCNVKKLDGTTIEIAQRIIDIFKDKYGLNLEIKQPNDIVYKNKKISGILTESKVISDNVKYLVVGIGINTSKTRFLNDIKHTATSIKKEFDIDVEPTEFVAEFCNRFEEDIIKRSK